MNWKISVNECRVSSISYCVTNPGSNLSDKIWGNSPAIIRNAVKPKSRKCILWKKRPFYRPFTFYYSVFDLERSFESNVKPMLDFYTPVCNIFAKTLRRSTMWADISRNNASNKANQRFHHVPIWILYTKLFNCLFRKFSKVETCN